jgi:hypothetical protein
LGESDARAERRGECFVQNAQLNRGRIERRDSGGGFAAAAIEQNNAIAWLKAKHIARMVRFGTSQDGR